METKFEKAKITISVPEPDCWSPVFEQTTAMVYAYIDMAKACWEAYWNTNFQAFSGIPYPASLTENENAEVNSHLQKIMVGFPPVTIIRH